jgi:two-component system, LytTR family, sensor kinase
VAVTPPESESTAARSSGYLRWAGLFVAAALVFATQEYVGRDWRGGPTSFRTIALAHGIAWMAWGLLTPLVVVPLVRRFPMARGTSVARDLAVHVAAMAILAALQTAIVAVTTATIYYGISPLATRDIFFDRAFTTFALNALIYATIAAIVRARELAAEARRRALETATLEARASRAELIALYGQLQPHFLFNALNGIAELTHSDPERAARMIRSIGELLRGSITGARTLTTTLRAEVEFVRRYVELQQMRFTLFEFQMRVDVEAMDAVVPPLLLQPLVENAIKHTIGESGAGRASLVAGRIEDRLVIVVSDDGPGFGGNAGAGTGVGLSTTRERLDRIFGDAYRLELSEPGAAGATVSIDIPFLTDHLTAPT